MPKRFEFIYLYVVGMYGTKVMAFRIINQAVNKINNHLFENSF